MPIVYAIKLDLTFMRYDRYGLNASISTAKV